MGGVCTLLLVPCSRAGKRTSTELRGEGREIMADVPTEGQLITRLQSGDVDALGALYERYKTQVYRTALAITHDPSTAEDILQDCFAFFGGEPLATKISEKKVFFI